MIPSCPLPPPAQENALSTQSWPIATAQRIQIALHYGDLAYSRGDIAGTVAKYREAAAGFVAGPLWGGTELDEELHLARILTQLHDRPTAQTLWRLYLRDTQAPGYGDQVRRLRTGKFDAFFAAMQREDGYYTGNHPADDGTAGAIARGAAAGARGDFVTAQRDFDEAIAGAVYSSAYATYAWGASAWALGDHANARRAWLCASDAGRDPMGDMAFNGAGNAAAVTMLLSFPSP